MENTPFTFIIRQVGDKPELLFNPAASAFLNLEELGAVDISFDPTFKTREVTIQGWALSGLKVTKNKHGICVPVILEILEREGYVYNGSCVVHMHDASKGNTKLLRFNMDQLLGPKPPKGVIPENKAGKVPPPWNEALIDKHINELVRKDKSVREIAQWFAIWGYTQGQHAIYVRQMMEETNR